MEVPLDATVEAGLAATRATLGAVRLAVTNLATLEASLVTSTATASLVAVAGGTEVVARASVTPSVVAGVWGCDIEAAIRCEAGGVTAPGVGTVAEGLGLLFFLLSLLLAAVTLGVLVC